MDVLLYDKTNNLVEKMNVVTSRLLAPEVRSSHNVMRPIAVEKAPRFGCDA